VSEHAAAAARLDAAALRGVPAAIERPRYALDTIGIGVAHFGPGAFHRAHQAWFFDAALTHDPRWGISGISLKSSVLRDALAQQDGLYTVAVLDHDVRYRVVGALRETLVAAQRDRVMERLVSAHTRIVTLTITEKGYCLDAAGQLDFAHADITADLAVPHAPTSALGHLVEALRLRRAAQIRPFTVISCDNLADNGGKLRAATIALAAARDATLARWIESHVAFPRSMVDSIVPATDAALLQRVDAALGVHDRWPVQREAFAQWVIEDRFCNDVPDWSAVGVTVSRDVAAWERAKLRLLNGAHSSLAYLGSLAGYETVAQAMDDTVLAAFVAALMRKDAQPTLQPPPELDLDAYTADILWRFRNPALRHLLAQIAWDGSQKLPFRLLGTVRDALAAGQPLERLCLAIAAWLHFVRAAQRDARALVDPHAAVLCDIARGCVGEGSIDVPRWLALNQVFGDDLPRAEAFVRGLTIAYDALAKRDLRDVLQRATGD
jgi:fructuronate reductase